MPNYFCAVYDGRRNRLQEKITSRFPRGHLYVYYVFLQKKNETKTRVRRAEHHSVLPFKKGILSSDVNDAKENVT